jgi:hypothetical protein
MMHYISEVHLGRCCTDRLNFGAIPNPEVVIATFAILWPKLHFKNISQ